jgi:hypothetical protein
MTQRKRDWAAINKAQRLMIWNLLLEVAMWGGWDQPLPEEA